MSVPTTPYAAVSDIKATSCTFYGSVVSWGGSSGQLRIEYRDVDRNGSWLHTEYRSSTTSFTVSNLLPGTHYEFRLYAFNNGGEWCNSSIYHFRTFPKPGTIYMPNGQKRSTELTIDVPYITQSVVNSPVWNYFLLPFGFNRQQCVMQMWFSREHGARPSSIDDYKILTARQITSSEKCFKFESTIRASTATSVPAWRESWTHAVHTGENGTWIRINEGAKWGTSDINVVSIYLESNSNQRCRCDIDWIGHLGANMWPGSETAANGAPPISGIWGGSVPILNANADDQRLYLNMNYREDDEGVNKPFQYPIYIYRIRLTTHSGSGCPPAISLYDLVPVKAGSTQYLPTPPTKDCFFDLCGQSYIYSNGTVKYGTHKRRVVPLSFSRDSNGNQVVRRIK